MLGSGFLSLLVTSVRREEGFSYHRSTRELEERLYSLVERSCFIIYTDPRQEHSLPYLLDFFLQEIHPLRQAERLCTC